MKNACVFGYVLLISLLIGQGSYAEIIDNSDPGFIIAGSWPISSFTPGYYGSNYQYSPPGSGSKTATWSFNVSEGQYEISAQWSSFVNRATNAGYTIFNNGLELGTVYENQREGGGQFNVLGTFDFENGILEVVLTDEADGYVIADAVQVDYLGPIGNHAPDGVIDTPSGDLTILVGDPVDFSGTGTDPDNDLPLTYLWQFGSGSGIPDSTVEDPGVVQFNNSGTFMVTFTVTDFQGLSDPTPATVNITVLSGTEPMIVDNADLGFTTQGSWPTSSFTPGYYGSNYQYSPPGSGSRTATWSFNVSEGEHEISAQWSSFVNRATNAGYDIYNNDSYLGTINVDQRVGGGQFNVLCTDVLDAGSLDVVLTDAADGYVIADAVKVVYLGSTGNHAPDGVIDTPAGDVTILVGESVSFTGTGSDPDPDDTLTYLWNFGSGSGIPDSTVEDPGPVQFNNEGIFTVTFTVTDNHGVSDSTPATVTIIVQSSVDTGIVDNTDPGFGTSGTWPASSFIPGYYGTNYQYGDPNTFSGTATWSFNIQKSKYVIYAQWASFSNRAANAKYVIKNNGTEIDAVCANQQFNGGMFNVLGTYSLESGTLEVVLNHDTDGIVIADAVKIENKFNTKPSVYIETPSDYHLQVSRDLVVRAHVNPLNDISNYGVRFVLDEDSGPSQVLDLNPPFEVIFGYVSLAEHQINAYLTDAAGDPIVGNATQDVVYNVGVGDYYVAMGDSITHGFADDNAIDDVSLEGRNDGGGYSPVLNDRLTSATGLPHTIENEGVLGAVSADGIAAISNLLTKHPQAVRFLILYGTNDVGMIPPVPSGKNLNPGHPDYPGTFKANIQQIVDVINNNGKEACIAKVPVQLADCSDCEWYSEPDNGARNAIVKNYNIALQELKDDTNNNINIDSPDFYTYYLDHYQTEYAGWLHPNGAGYQSMADLWEQALIY